MYRRSRLALASRSLDGAKIDSLCMEAIQEIVQHWILNLAVEMARNIADFVPYVESLSLNVPPVPGVTPSQYCESFLALLDRGRIKCFEIAGNEGEKREVDRSLVESVIAARLQLPHVTSKRCVGMMGPVGSSRPNLEWEMTTAGGEQWERPAQPNWERYVSACFGFSSEEGSSETGDAWSTSLDTLMLEIGWCSEFNRVDVDRQSLNLAVLHDYPITYWKVLPVVYHLSFSCRSVGREQRDLRSEAKWFRDWWISRCAWHKEPWSVQGWPDAQGDA